ncbi:hypothetical protein QJQ45_004820 [Haematococcus lacustris]|nr:hypothetical protein QJQ45_004820 [Haematococcus lacustris]
MQLTCKHALCTYRFAGMHLQADRPLAALQRRTPHGQTRCNVHVSRPLVSLPGQARKWPVLVRATADEQLDVRRLSDIITSEPLDAEERFSLERLANTLDVSMGTIKAMAFKRKGLLNLTPEEVHSKLQRIADVVEVPVDKARQMAIIQPGLLMETERTAETLKAGIRSISYELGAPKDEVVELILTNQSVLHGRELRLSVADMAHLAMLREPKGRVVD